MADPALNPTTLRLKTADPYQLLSSGSFFVLSDASRRKEEREAQASGRTIACPDAGTSHRCPTACRRGNVWAAVSDGIGQYHRI